MGNKRHQCSTVEEGRGGRSDDFIMIDLEDVHNLLFK